MPRFYFHLRAESTIRRDLTGVDCRDLSAANALARDIAVELMRNCDRKTSLWSLCVENERGRPLFNLYFADLAESAKGLSQERQVLAAENCRRVTALIDVMCAVRRTVAESQILLARARGKPHLVYDSGGGARGSLGPHRVNSS